MTNRSLAAVLFALSALSCSQQDFVTDVPLRVVASTPSGAATGVPRNATLEITFSEGLVPATVLRGVNDEKDTTLHLESLGEVAADGTASGSGQPQLLLCGITYSDEGGVPKVTISPKEPFNFSTRIRVRIDTTVLRARDKGPLPVPVSFTFDTENPPVLRVLSVSPADTAAGLARDAKVRVVFSEPVDCASLQAGATLTEGVDPHPHTADGGPSLAVTGTWDCPQVSPTALETLDGTHCSKNPDKCTVTFRPTDDAFRFRYSSSVTLALAGGDTATAPLTSARATVLGGRLVADAVSTFRVVDPPALALMTAAPANGATGVQRDGGITLSFSEPVDCDLFQATGAVTVSQQLDGHARFGTRANTTEPLAGTWACPTPTAGAAEGPAGCGDGGVNCRAVYTLAQGEVMELSADLQVEVAGGAYDAGTAPDARDRLESLRATTRGGQLPTDVAFSARAEDPDPLLVLSSSPGDTANGVPVTLQGMRVSLSRGVLCSTVTSGTVQATVDSPVRGSLTAVTSGPWTLTPDCTTPVAPAAPNTFFDLLPAASGALPYSSTVNVTLKGGASGVESADATTRGGQLSQDVTLSFRTEDPPTLRLVASQPSGGATGVGTSEPLVFSFSEGLDCSSINATTVRVRQSPAVLASGAAVPPPSDVACTFTCPWAGDAHKAACAHAPFLPSADVEVTLQGGNGTSGAIESSAATDFGGQLPTTEVFHFLAEDPAALSVVGTSPNGNPGVNVSANSDVRFTFSRAVRCSTVAGRVTLQRADTGAPVPGTVTCTNGTSVGPAVDGTVVIFTPSAPLLVEKRYRATAGAGIEAVDATLVGGGARGMLPTDVSTLFDVAFENLKIVTTVPTLGAQQASIGTKVAVQFNQAVVEGSLQLCTPSSNVANCNVVVTHGSTPFNWATGNLATEALSADGAPTYDGSTFRWSVDPSDTANAPNLSASTQYTVTLKGGISGPLGQNGVSRLPVDFSYGFRTSSAQLVVNLQPEDQATDVTSAASVCVDFTGDVDVSTLTAGGEQLTLTYQDAFGRTAPLPLDPTTPYLVSGANATTDRVCFNLVNTPYACGPGEFRLRPGTTYTATVSTSVKVGSSFPSASFSWSFTTRAPPALDGVWVSNAVISEPLANGALEVPVNGAFTVRFAEPMDAQSLIPANIRLVPLGNAAPVITTVTTDGQAQPLAVTLTPPATGLAHGALYAVELLGGTGGVTSAAGHPLDTDVRVAFTTSPATVVTLSPPESQLSPNALIPVVADRALYQPTVTSETVYATLAGNRINGIVALQPFQPRAATYIANPTWAATNAGPYVVRTTTGMLDFRGNPVPATTSQGYTTGNTPSNAAIQPTLLTTSNVSLTPNSQAFGVVLGGTGLPERMLSTSYYSLDPTASSVGTVSLTAVGGSGCPAAGTKLQLETVLAPSINSGIQDKVTSQVVGPLFMKSGCEYTFKVRQGQTANLFNQGRGQDVDYRAFGEGTVPTLVSLELQKTDGTFALLSAEPNKASGRAVLRATFSEPLAAETVTPINVNVAVPSGTLPGTLTRSGNVVTWTSSAYLAAGTSISVTLTNGLRDLATNAYAGSSQSFSVETSTPTFSSVAWDASPSREAPHGTATLTFSEPVDPATLSCNTQGTVGSVSVNAGGVPLYGCAVQSGTNANQVLWRPAEPLPSGTAVDVVVNGAGVTRALKDFAGSAVQALTRSFTP